MIFIEFMRNSINRSSGHSLILQVLSRDFLGMLKITILVFEKKTLDSRSDRKMWKNGIRKDSWRFTNGVHVKYKKSIIHKIIILSRFCRKFGNWKFSYSENSPSATAILAVFRFQSPKPSPFWEQGCRNNDITEQVICYTSPHRSFYFSSDIGVLRAILLLIYFLKSFENIHDSK